MAAVTRSSFPLRSPARLVASALLALAMPLAAVAEDTGCLSCHTFIEDAMLHMPATRSCTFCHGGNGTAVTIGTAHVQPSMPVINDATSAPLDYDLPYQRFVNPSNLRVADQTCGACHPDKVEMVIKSMMATTAGHLAGGLYQAGVVDTKTPVYANYATVDDDGNVPVEGGAVASLLDMISFDPTGDPTLFATHYAAVPAQACARCHLWSRGRGYRGAVGEEGIYRADGCAACHMLYADDGLSQSLDTSIDHAEPGHPISHIITKDIPTDQCLHCHHRGARIGLTFTGRAQMPPRLPSGPGVPGTTDVKFNRNYHYSDPATNPPDIHHEAGLECIDCHTSAGIMGDGDMWGHMDQATKVECRTCHGTRDERGTRIDHDGIPLNNIVDDLSEMILTSKVSGAQHGVVQVMDLVDPGSPDYNPKAAAAMTDVHIKPDGGLECYACHSAWVSNCFGCHFERNEQLLGLNLITREWETGKVSTNNKIFESLRHFTIGPNSEGRIAPYIVSCHPIADVTAPDGTKILDFVMPSTDYGLSGLAHNPVQPHSVRGAGEVRECAECHRSPPTLGLGTGNYSLARTYAFGASDSGLAVFERWSVPTEPMAVATLPATGAQAVTSLPNVVEGTADYIYVASGSAGVSIFDLSTGIPSGPVTTIAGIDAIDVNRVARYLNVVVAGVGVNIYDNADPETAIHVATVAIPTALRVVEWGIHMLVAAGNQGLFVVDVSDNRAPMIVGWLPGINAVDVQLYSHFQMGSAFAVRAYVADPDAGVHVVDLLPHSTRPRLVTTLALPGATGLDTYTSFVTSDGATPSREHDYLYVAAGTSGLRVYDITAVDAIVEVGAETTLGGNVVDVDVSSHPVPPGVENYALLANAVSGLQVVDVTDPTTPILLTTVAGVGLTRVFVEVQQMDRFLDEQGNELKENSHPFINTYNRADLVRILSAELPDPCDFDIDCDDGLVCNGSETCNPGVGCVAGTAIDCSGLDDECNDGVCDFATGTCFALPHPEDSLCDDGLFCTGINSCQANVCSVILGDPCVAGTVCNETTDQCDADTCVDVRVGDGVSPVNCPIGIDCTIGVELDTAGWDVGSVVATLGTTSPTNCGTSCEVGNGAAGGTCQLNSAACRFLVADLSSPITPFTDGEVARVTMQCTQEASGQLCVTGPQVGLVSGVPATACGDSCVPFECTACLPGDCNASGSLDAGDPVCAVLCLIGQPHPDADCSCGADCNCVQGVEAADPVCGVLRLISLFDPDSCLGDPPPALVYGGGADDRSPALEIGELRPTRNGRRLRTSIRITGETADTVAALNAALSSDGTIRRIRVARRMKTAGFVLTTRRDESGVAAVVVTPPVTDDGVAAFGTGKVLSLRLSRRTIELAISYAEFGSTLGLPLAARY